MSNKESRTLFSLKTCTNNWALSLATETCSPALAMSIPSFYVDIVTISLTDFRYDDALHMLLKR